MTAARELLDRLAEIGATVSRVDDRLILRAGSQPVPAALVKRAHQARMNWLWQYRHSSRGTILATTFSGLDQ
jgi:hypothetical protein